MKEVVINIFRGSMFIVGLSVVIKLIAYLTGGGTAGVLVNVAVVAICLLFLYLLGLAISGILPNNKSN